MLMKVLVENHFDSVCDKFNLTKTEKRTIKLLILDKDINYLRQIAIKEFRSLKTIKYRLFMLSKKTKVSSVVVLIKMIFIELLKQVTIDDFKKSVELSNFREFNNNDLNKLPRGSSIIGNYKEAV